jgi:hypothetical protein
VIDGAVDVDDYAVVVVGAVAVVAVAVVFANDDAHNVGGEYVAAGVAAYDYNANDNDVDDDDDDVSNGSNDDA